MSFGRFTRRRVSSLFVILVLTIGCCLPAFGQMINRRQVSRLGLSAAERSELLKRFQLFVEYEKAGAYDKQYELLAKDHLAGLVRIELDQESYVKFKRETAAATGKLLEVKVRDIKRVPGPAGGFNFAVEVKLEKNGRVYSDTPIFAGYLIDGTWYFSIVYVN